MKNIFVSILTLLLTQYCVAQSTLSGQVHLGYSSPFNMETSYIFTAYHTGGKVSQGIFVAYEKKKKRHHIRFQSGINLLGFEAKFYLGKTPNPLFPTLENGLPILSTSTYQLGYWDNSLSYGLSINSKAKLMFSLHYLQNFRSHLSETYRFMNPNLLSEARYTTTIDADLKKIGQQFYNHWAASTELQYPIIKNLNIGFNYFIGLQEFNPLMLEDKGYNRLNQNFSIFISQIFWTFGKK